MQACNGLPKRRPARLPISRIELDSALREPSRRESKSVPFGYTTGTPTLEPDQKYQIDRRVLAFVLSTVPTLMVGEHSFYTCEHRHS